jgi:hypothetical protein
MWITSMCRCTVSAGVSPSHSCTTRRSHYKTPRCSSPPPTPCNCWCHTHSTVRYSAYSTVPVTWSFACSWCWHPPVYTGVGVLPRVLATSETCKGRVVGTLLYVTQLAAQCLSHVRVRVRVLGYSARLPHSVLRSHSNRALTRRGDVGSAATAWCWRPSPSTRRSLSPSGSACTARTNA